MPIRVLIVDDDPGFLEYLRTALADSPAIEVIGSAADGIEALRQVEKLAPEVVTMDLDMPRLDGVEAARIILERHAGTMVVMVSGSENHAEWLGLEETGAHDFVRKSRVGDEIEEAILAAASQHRPLRLIHV